MQNLIHYIQSKIKLAQNEIELINKYFVMEEIPAQTKLLKPGKIERYVYFLSKGIVKGYENIDGKIIVQHLIYEQNFFASLDSFMTERASNEFFESVTDCSLIKISKVNFERIQKEIKSWSVIVAEITNDHLNCKLERVKDFQTLSAKERYLKFVKKHPELALNVSIENIASYLGMEPQSLSRIRKQITI